MQGLVGWLGTGKCTLRAQVKASRLCCLPLSIPQMGKAAQILLGTRPFISFQRSICPEHTPLGGSGCLTPWLRALGCLPGQGRRQDPRFSSAKPTRSRRQAAGTPASCGQGPPVVMATGRAAASPAPLRCPAVGSCRYLSPRGAGGTPRFTANSEAAAAGL